MKKLLIIIVILSAYQLNCNTMVINSFVVLNAESINPYMNIWDAISMAESHKNCKAYNSRERATGIVQIRPIRLKDYNQRTNSHYKLSDCFNIEVSKKIFMYYAEKFKPHEYNKIATDWNKCKNNSYWNIVKKHLEKTNS